MLPGRYLGTFHSPEAALEARDRFLEDLNRRQEQAESEPDEPTIEGWTNEDGALDPDELWAQAFKAQLQAEEQAWRRQHQTITIHGEEPFALAYLSDLHIGAASTDYRALRADAEIIRDTPRMWAGYHGDGINNWIVGKLAALERDEIVPFDAEIALFADWLRMVGPSLLWVVAGNHENWTRQIAGIDLLRGLLGDDVRVLYDRFEVCFRLVWGERVWRYKVRHKWRYSSIFNATHAIEVGWQRGSTDFDVGLGGHTHVGTVCRPFWRHGHERYAVLTGTYNIGDPYGRELGLSAPMHRGSGAHVYWKDGATFCHSLEEARALLERLS